MLPSARMANAMRDPALGGLVPVALGHFGMAGKHCVRRPDGCQDLIITLLGGGSGWSEVSGVRRIHERRAFWVLPMHLPHAYGSAPDSPWTIWWAHLRGERARVLFSDLDGLQVDSSAWLRVTSLFEDAIEAVLAEDDPGSLVLASGCLAHLAGVLGRPNMVATSDPVRSTVSWIDAHLDRPMGLAVLARMAGLSVAQYLVRFRAMTGCSPIEYHLRRRISGAAARLTAGREPVAAVAEAFGFADPAYFSRQFRARMGMSPLAWRNRR